MLRVHNIFRLLGVLTVASVFLQGIFFLYLPFPFRVAQFYLLLWIPLIMLYDFRLLLNKSMALALTFIVIMYFGLELLWKDSILGSDENRLLSVLLEMISIIGSVMIYSYFLKSKDLKGLRIVIYSSLIFITITTIITINGLDINPMAVRLNMSGNIDQIEDVVKSLGLGGYGFFNGIMLLVPALAYFFNNPEFDIKKKIFILIFIIFLCYPIALGGLTTNLILAGLFFIYAALFVPIFKAKPYIPLLIISIFLFTFNHFTSDILKFLSDVMMEGIIKHKLNELSTTVKLMDYNPESGRTYFAYSRLTLTTQSLEGFLANPLIGSGNIGGHAYWLDRLAEYGLVGWLPIILIFYQQVKFQKYVLLKVHYQYFIISVYAIILFGVLKGNAINVQTMLVLFFLVPGIFLLERMKLFSNSI